jgi:hypothetical protein
MWLFEDTSVCGARAKGLVALKRVKPTCKSFYRHVGRIRGPMAVDLPQISKSVPCKHESSINFAK